MKYALILFIVLLIGCKTVTKTVQVDNIITTEFHDTVIVVERDSAARVLLIQCDSAYNAYVKGDTVKNGKHVEIVYKLKNNVLTITAPVDSFAIYLKWKEIYDRLNTTITEIQEPKHVVNWWAWAFFGLLAFALGVIAILAKIIMKR